MGGTVWEYENEIAAGFLPYPVVKRIPIGDYEPGLYTIEVTVTDVNTHLSGISERDFSLTRHFMVYTQRVFSDDDEEFELISYFLNSRQRRQGRTLSPEGKKNFIDRFWTQNDPNLASNDNIFLETTRRRVNEANWRYSHHRAGWKTDLGRIYIKYGDPDSIDQRETSPDSRYARRPYQIWRYYNSARLYVFIDLQGGNNYRLVYVVNDETEFTDTSWRMYFGADFEESDFGH